MDAIRTIIVEATKNCSKRITAYTSTLSVWFPFPEWHEGDDYNLQLHLDAAALLCDELLREGFSSIETLDEAFCTRLGRGYVFTPCPAPIVNIPQIVRKFDGYLSEKHVKLINQTLI